MNWSLAILEHEPAIRLASFFGILFLMAAWEVRAPCRPLSLPRRVRWSSNLGLVALNSIVLRLLFPAAGLGIAVFAQQQGWGLFNHFPLPLFAAVVVSVVALDFLIYLQHVMMHAVPVFWRLHRVHHVDLDFDCTTGARFHPVEIVLSMLIKAAAILLLGPPLLAVVIFEVLLNATAMFNHGNVQLPRGLDRLLRSFIVTPDMHRVHHSIEENETNSNFGFSLSWWDRLCGTYRDQPRAGHQGMTIGIRELRDPQQVDRLPGMLALPFAPDTGGYAINRRDVDKPR